MTTATGDTHLSLLSKIGLVLLVGLISLVSLLFYLQTRHGFRHVILPLASKFTGAKLEAHDGFFSLLGTLEADGLVYQQPAAGISFDAVRLAIRARPWSIVSEGVPRIDDLELKKANLRVVVPPKVEEVAVEEKETEPSESIGFIPVAVERANFEEVTITVQQEGSRTTARVNATLEQLGPGRAGNVRIQTGFLLGRDGSQDISGSVDLDLPVEIGPGGTPIKWNGSNRVLLRTGRGPLDPSGRDVFTIVQMIEGEYAYAEESVRVASNLAIAKAGAALGTVELNAVRNGGTHPAATDVSLAMAGITADTLNLLLGGTSPTFVHAGRFDARLESHLEGGLTSVRGKVNGRGIRLGSAKREASPAVDISLQHGGSYNSATREVAIETFALSIDDGVKTLLSGALDRPVSLHLGRAEEDTQPSNTAAEAAVFSLKLAQSEVQELRPWLALMGDDPLKEVTAGRFGASLVVSIYERGAIVDVNGKLESSGVMLKSEGSGQAGFMGPLGLDAEWRSRLSGLKLLKFDPLTTTFSLKGKQIGVLQATGSMKFAETTELTSMNGTLKLSGLPGETLNPLLALWGQTRIGRAQIDGHADIVIEEDRARWEIDLRGQDIQLRLPSTPTDAPPLDLLIKQVGGLDRAAQKIRLDQLALQVLERRRSVLTVSLDQPLTLSLSKGKDAEVSKSSQSQEPITVGLRVNHLGVHQLRPWVALTGSEALARIRNGAVDADLKVRFRGVDEVAVAGRLDLEELAIQNKDRVSSAPVTLGTEVRATVVGKSRLAVDSWTVKARQKDKLLAQAHLTGSAESAGATDMALDMTAGNVSQFMGALGLLTERQEKMIAGGSFKGSMHVVTAGPANPLTLKGGLRADELNIRLDKARPLTRSIGFQIEIDVDAARTLAEFQKAEIVVEAGGINAGIVTAKGHWPLGGSAVTTSGGAVNVTMKELDSAPFAEFFGFLPGRGPGPLPVNAEFKFTQQEGGKSFGIEGKETVGPISLAGRAGELVSATVRVEQDVTQSGDEIKVGRLSLTAERSKGLSDRAVLSGSFRTGENPRLQLVGGVEAFDADWYAALIAPSGEQTLQSKPPGKKSDTNADQAGFAVPLDLDVDLTIGRVIYRSLEIGKGRLIAKGDGRRMQATLQPTGIAAGSVQGTIIISMKDAQPEFSWNTKGDSLDLGALIMALLAEPEARFSGLGKFSSAGTGRGQGELLRQSLDGNIVFDVTDGQFLKSPMLDFLAEQTHIDEFKKFGFKTLHGELQIKEGWMKIREMRADGPAVALEASGQFGLDGRLDLQVQPKLGPTLSQRLKIPCLDQFAKTADGFTVLPVGVTVGGTTDKPEYGATVATAGSGKQYVGALVGTVADLLTGCSGGERAQKTTEETVDVIKEKATDLMESLLGGKKKR